MSNDTRGQAASDTEASDSTRVATDRSVNRYLEDRVRELEAEDAHLHRSREIWRAAAEAARRDREWTSERIASLGPAFRIWLTLRGAFRRSRSFLRLPIDLFRAVNVPIDPLRIPTRPEGALVAESTVRAVIGALKRELESGTMLVTVPQIHPPGAEGEVDFGEASIWIGWILAPVEIFHLRLSHSARAVHVAFASEG